MSRVSEEIIKFGQCSSAQKTILKKCFKCFFELNEDKADLLEHSQQLFNNINEYYKNEYYKTKMESDKKIEEANYKGKIRTTLSVFDEVSTAKFGSVLDKDKDCMSKSKCALSNGILQRLNPKIFPEGTMNLTVSERLVHLYLKDITNIYIVSQLLEYFDGIGINKNTIWNFEPSHTIKDLSDRIRILEEKIDAIL
jgi:hypothetical protein